MVDVGCFNFRITIDDENVCKRSYDYKVGLQKRIKEPVLSQSELRFERIKLFNRQHSE